MKLEKKIVNSSEFIEIANGIIEKSKTSSILAGAERLTAIGATETDSYLFTAAIRGFFTHGAEIVAEDGSPYLMLVDCSIETANIRYESIINAMTMQSEINGLINKIRDRRID